MNRALTVARHDLVWLRRDPAPVITMLLTPALLMFFIKPLYVRALDRLGYSGVNGAELAVPGMTVMFSFFMAGLVTESVFREHGLNTWARLRVSPLRDTELMTGKVRPVWSWSWRSPVCCSCSAGWSWTCGYGGVCSPCWPS
ncbi:ABC transporter permease [Streptomyces tauricus]|uniref:ABC transporter permease n=1 Tax=Streptomyces tauricus TaxID=68274 RepID=UPI002244E7B6|nr:ABC transporter permease [Streptomyces tauricus]MCW8098725.1 ABC transporter permease [Streptomyces tauricus]